MSGTDDQLRPLVAAATAVMDTCAALGRLGADCTAEDIDAVTAAVDAWDAIWIFACDEDADPVRSTSFTSARLVAQFAPLLDIVQAINAAIDHDIGCDLEEDCCQLVWRLVYIAAGRARNVTVAERAALAALLERS